MQILYRIVFCCLMVLPVEVYAQVVTPVTVDFSQLVYSQPLDYSGKEIGEIKRQYASYVSKPVIVRVPAIFKGSGFRSVSDFNLAQFDSTVSFSSAGFYSDAFFVSAQFHAVSSFRGARFYSIGDFEHTRFDSFSDFSFAEFHSTSSFISAQFYSAADLNFTQFYSASNFSYTYFHASANFRLANFHSGCDFYRARFYSTCDFTEAQFDSTTYFQEIEFDSTLIFNRAKFNKDVHFTYAHFSRESKLQMQHIRVSGSASFDFSHAVLPDTIDLSNNPAIFLGVPATIDFTLADSLKMRASRHDKSLLQYLRHPGYYLYPNDTAGDWKKVRINLYNTDVSKVKIDYDHFVPYLGDTLKKDTISADVRASLYEGVLKNFKDRGQTISYEKMDIEYRRFKDDLGPNDFSVQDWWWRYGYERGRIFIHALIFIVVFSLFNFFFIDRLNKKDDGVYRIDYFPEFTAYKPGLNIRRLPQCLKRLWFSFIYTSTLFFLLTLKIENMKFYRAGHSYGRFLATVWIMFIYTVGLICMGFMANLVLQK